jgi:hypothetical protein
VLYQLATARAAVALGASGARADQHPRPLPDEPRTDQTAGTVASPAA